MSRRALGAACLVALTTVGCAASRAWKYDESHRIDEAMRCEPFRPEHPGARGIAVYSAPPLAPPWQDGEGYQIRRDTRGRKGRLGKVDRKPPRARRPETTQL